MSTIPDLETMVEVLAEAVRDRDRQIADIEAELKLIRSNESQWRVYLHNICGMAIEKFPEILRGCWNQLDVPNVQYEVIRQAFCKIPKRQPTSDTSTPEAGGPNDSGKPNADAKA